MLMSTHNGASLVGGSGKFNNKVREDKMTDKIKLNITRNVFLNGKELQKGKTLDFDKKDKAWLDLVHANAAEIVQDEEVPKKNKEVKK